MKSNVSDILFKNEIKETVREVSEKIFYNYCHEYYITWMNFLLNKIRKDLASKVVSIFAIHGWEASLSYTVFNATPVLILLNRYQQKTKVRNDEPDPAKTLENIKVEILNMRKYDSFINKEDVFTMAEWIFLDSLLPKENFYKDVINKIFIKYSDARTVTLPVSEVIPDIGLQASNFNNCFLTIEKCNYARNIRIKRYFEKLNINIKFFSKRKILFGLFTIKEINLENPEYITFTW